jgi:anti-sigma factor RsiW
MNCRQARAAMERAADHEEALRSEHEAHLAACPSCGREWARLQALEALLQGAQACPEPGPAMGVVFGRAVRQAALSPAPFRPRSLAWAGVALLAFVLGFGARGLTTAPQAPPSAVPQVRTVRVEVPVVKERVVERVVVKRVPVVRVRYTRVPAPVEPAAAPPVEAPTAQPDTGPEVVVETLPSPALPSEATWTESTRLARLATDQSMR